MTEAPEILLAHHLKTLKLPTFLREYEKLARQCAAEGLDHVRFLARLVELELIDRDGTDAAIEHLAGHDYGAETTQAALENGYVYDEPGEGTNDRVAISGDFFLEPEAENFPFKYAPGTEHDLAPYLSKCELSPRFKALVDSIPRSATGKIMWRQLQEQEWTKATQPA